MYVRPTYTFYQGTTQHAARSSYLILFTNSSDELRGLVRQVAMRQLGNFMMGKAKILDRWITVSGQFGSDGLPIDITVFKDGWFKDDLWEKAVPIPKEIAEAFWKDEEGYTEKLIAFSREIVQKENES